MFHGLVGCDRHAGVAASQPELDVGRLVCGDEITHFIDDMGQRGAFVVLEEDLQIDDLAALCVQAQIGR
ncbi:hypothetical protein SDC9_205181 [bioreactor metagenome]|uniref:Uncharacterized protein n=1 Tax=bioreactor metagenome TaxID=1076179 RepID=A0A645J254_9ZZZZ